MTIRESKRVSFWDQVINKVKSRLSRWKERLLSMAGRVCLIKSVITTLPLFYWSFFKALLVCAIRLGNYKLSFYGVGEMRVRE